MTFKEERRGGVGGSDIGSILNLEPYGCSRRLWYTKQGTEPDHPRAKNVLDRGHALEEIVCQWLSDEHNVFLGRVEFTVRDPHRPHLFCHPDRLVTISNGKFSEGDVVEAKTAGREIFHKIRRDGLQEDYIAQGQYNAELVYRQSGREPKAIHFPVLWPDGWVFELITEPRDREMGAELAEAADEWWRLHGTTGDPPDRLPASDKRCQKCEFRTGCQGKRMLEVAEEQGDDVSYVDLGDDFTALLEEYRDMVDIRDEAKDEVEALKDRIKERLGDLQAVDVPGYRVSFKASPRNGYTVKPTVVRALRVTAK